MSGPETVTWAYRVQNSSIDDLSDALDLAHITVDGLSEELGVVTAWFSQRPSADLPRAGLWEPVRQADWSELWKVGLQPVSVGTITVAPPWLAPGGPSLDGRQPVIVIEPGMAFGTGHHETTTACLAAMQDLDLCGARMIDIGTGTGVLALAAVALGAEQVVAVDTDPEAITVARDNIAAHGPVAASIDLRLGSCEVVGRPGDLVVANIITDKLMALAPALVPLVVPGGTLLTAGVAVERLEEAIAAFAKAGLSMTGRPGREWAVLIGRR